MKTTVRTPENSLTTPISRREFLKVSSRYAAATAVLGTGTFGYARFAEVGNYSLSNLSLTIPGLHERIHGFKIVQLSDLHLDGIDMTREKLVSIVEMSNAQHPDLVVITGDFVTYDPERFAQDLIAGLKDLKAKYGVLGIPGNHDHWTNVDVIRAVLREAGVEDLSNRARTVEVDGIPLHIGGLDDSWVAASRPEELMQKVPREGTAILLSHEPDFADEWARLGNGRFSLNLAGHSHGGQLSVPFVGPIQLPEYGVKYHTGLYRIGNMLHYTSRGLGTLRPHVRLNCRPELPVFTLLSPGVS